MKKEQILFREGLIPCWCDKYPECPNQPSKQTIDERWNLQQNKKQLSIGELRKTFNYRHSGKPSMPVDVVGLNAHIRKVLGL